VFDILSHLYSLFPFFPFSPPFLPLFPFSSKQNEIGLYQQTKFSSHSYDSIKFCILVMATTLQKVCPAPHPKDIKNQNQFSEGRNVGWLGLVDVRRATRVGLITDESMKRENSMTK